MENNIENSEIELWINQIVEIFGIKEPANYRDFKKFASRKNISRFIEKIASYMGLPVKVNVSFVSEEYRPSSINSTSFETKKLTDYDSTGQNISGITAQVIIPSYLPLYGSSSIKNFPIDIKVSENCLVNPKTLIAVLAHELAHIVLNSVRHNQKENEFYTDLTAMVLGFLNIHKDGRKNYKTSYENDFFTTTTINNVTTYGYLSDKQFDFAYKTINNLLKISRRLHKQLKSKFSRYKQLINSYKKEMCRFNRYLECLDDNRLIKFNSSDSKNIILFHQVGYTEKFRDVVTKNMERINDINLNIKKIDRMRHYFAKKTEQKIEAIEKYIQFLNNELEKIRQDTRILSKYINLYFKVKTSVNLLNIFGRF